MLFVSIFHVLSLFYHLTSSDCSCKKQKSVNIGTIEHAIQSKGIATDEKETNTYLHIKRKPIKNDIVCLFLKNFINMHCSNQGIVHHQHCPMQGSVGNNHFASQPRMLVTCRQKLSKCRPVMVVWRGEVYHVPDLFSVYFRNHSH